MRWRRKCKPRWQNETNNHNANREEKVMGKNIAAGIAGLPFAAFVFAAGGGFTGTLGGIRAAAGLGLTLSTKKEAAPGE